jgi:hypothetical protein
MVLCIGLLHAQKASADSFTIPLDSSNCEFCTSGSLTLQHDGTGFHFQGSQEIHTVNSFPGSPELDGAFSYSLLSIDPVDFYNLNSTNQLPGLLAGMFVGFNEAQPDGPGPHSLTLQEERIFIGETAGFQTAIIEFSHGAVTVPEPTSGMLLATSLLSLVGLVAWRWKQTA